MAKEVKSKRQPMFRPGQINWTFGAIYELIYSFITPVVKLNLTIDIEPTLYSIVSSTDDDKRYLLLNVQCKRKAIGNLIINAVGNFYDDEKRKLAKISVEFSDLPEVIEASDEVNLKCLTELDVNAITNVNTRIVINITYDYVYTNYIRTVNKTFTCRFDLTSRTFISDLT